MYIYRRTGTNTWGEQYKIIAFDGAPHDSYGSKLCISGDYAIVGSPNDDDNGQDSGSVYIYHRTGTNIWDSVTKIKPSDGGFNERFGCSVGISGDYVIVGAFLDDDKGTDSGSAYIFRRTGTNAWGDEVKLTAADGSFEDSFGISVSIDGEYAIVGSEPLGTNAPYAYIYHRTGLNTWEVSAKIISPDNAAGFGGSVSINGDYTVIGAPSEDKIGTAYLYARTEQ